MLLLTIFWLKQRYVPQVPQRTVETFTGHLEFIDYHFLTFKTVFDVELSLSLGRPVSRPAHIWHLVVWVYPLLRNIPNASDILRLFLVS
jgi:hypothetical protein